MYKRIKQVLAVFMIFSLIVSYVNLHVLAKEDAEIILHQGETYKIPMSDMLISQKEKSDVVFYSENELVAEVDKEGLVTAIIPGNTFIVCESKVKDATPSQLEVHKWKVEVLEDKELNKSIEQKNAASVNGIEYLTLQEAVDSSNDEDVILLLRDTRESVVSSGKNFSLNLMGNTLSAETGKRTLELLNGSIKIENGTISGGEARKASGGGIYALNMKMDILNVCIEDNLAKRGGGVFLDGNTEANFLDCQIINNIADDREWKITDFAGGQGGGIYVNAGASITLTDTEVSYNYVGNNEIDRMHRTVSEGGGIYLDSKIQFEMENCSIIGNEVHSNSLDSCSGGGIYISSSDSKIDILSGRIEENKTDGAGGGIYVNAGGQPLKLFNVLITQNEGRDLMGGGGIGCCHIGSLMAYSTNGGLITENISTRGKMNDIGFEWKLRPQSLPLRNFYGQLVEYYDDGSTKKNAVDLKTGKVLDIEQLLEDNNNETVGLKVQPVEYDEDDFSIIIKNNRGLTSGGIQNNGSIHIGENKDKTITVKKEWENPADMLDEVEIELYHDDKRIEMVTLNSDNEWTYKFEDLPGNYEYFVKEKENSGYEAEIEILEESENEWIYTITNKKLPETVYQTLSVQKIWKDDIVEERPENIRVQLLCNNQPYGEEIILNEENSWFYMWEELEDSYEWTVIETNIPERYNCNIKQDGNMVIITNVFIPQVKTGGLTIVNRVHGNMLESGKKYPFVLTLNDPTINGIYGDLLFINGIAKFELGNEESSIVTGLPAGTSYEVKKIQVNESGCILDTEKVMSGIILDGIVEEKVFISCEEEPVNPDEPGVPDKPDKSRYGNLTIKKMVRGIDSDQKFSFEIKIKDKDGNPLLKLPFNGSFSGTISYGQIIKIGDEEFVTITQIPENSTYQIMEKEADTDNWKTTMENATGIISADDDNICVFTNIYRKQEPSETPDKDNSPEKRPSNLNSKPETTNNTEVTIITSESEKNLEIQEPEQINQEKKRISKVYDENNYLTDQDFLAWMEDNQIPLGSVSFSLYKQYIDSIEKPLASLPKTGDKNHKWKIMFLMSFLSLIVVSILERKSTQIKRLNLKNGN